MNSKSTASAAPKSTAWAAWAWGGSVAAQGHTQRPTPAVPVPHSRPSLWLPAQVGLPTKCRPTPPARASVPGLTGIQSCFSESIRVGRRGCDGFWTDCQRHTSIQASRLPVRRGAVPARALPLPPPPQPPPPPPGSARLPGSVTSPRCAPAGAGGVGRGARCSGDSGGSTAASGARTVGAGGPAGGGDGGLERTFCGRPRRWRRAGKPWRRDSRPCDCRCFVSGPRQHPALPRRQPPTRPIPPPTHTMAPFPEV
jgi:hypothetical protein